MTDKEEEVESQGTGPTVKKFQNGWTREVEKLMAEWADKAICYRWMHEKTERIFYHKDLAFMFPVIILSTVTGAANFALSSVITDPTAMNYAQLGLGGLSILTGIISTIANRLAYGSGSEAHKGAAILWGKFQRLIAIELSLNPDERSDCMFFLKTCRSELDRLIERAPTIPADVIEACKIEFKHYPTVRKPEIVGDIDTTSIYDSGDARRKHIEDEALEQKKDQLKQFMIDDLEPILIRMMDDKTKQAAKSKGQVQSSTSVSQAATKAARMKEVHQIAMSGVVSEMRQKLAGFTPVAPAPNNIHIIIDEGEISGISGISGIPGIPGISGIPTVDEITPDDNHLRPDENDKV